MSVKAMNDLPSDHNVGGRPRQWTEELIEIEAKALEEWNKDPNNYYATNFFAERGISRQHIQKFCNYSARFRDAWSQAKELQEKRLVNLAVTRKGDPGFIKFMLCAKEGWKDQTTVNHNLNPLASLLDKIAVSDNQPITIEPIIEPFEEEPNHSSGVVSKPNTGPKA